MEDLFEYFRNQNIGHSESYAFLPLAKLVELEDAVLSILVGGKEGVAVS